MATPSDNEMTHRRGFAAWFEHLAPVWQFVIIIATTAAIASTATLAVVGIVNLPDRVDALEKNDRQHIARIVDLENAKFQTERVLKRMECILIADIQDQRWERCIASSPYPPPQTP